MRTTQPRKPMNIEKATKEVYQVLGRDYATLADAQKAVFYARIRTITNNEANFNNAQFVFNGVDEPGFGSLSNMKIYPLMLLTMAMMGYLKSQDMDIEEINDLDELIERHTQNNKGNR